MPCFISAVVTPCVPSLMTTGHVFNDWQSSTMYNVPTNGHMQPPFMHGMAYPPSEYNLIQEIHHDGSYCKDNGKRNGRVKGSRKDNYNHMYNHANEMQAGYMSDERFIPRVPIFLQFFPEHTVPPQQHPVTGQIYYAPPMYSQSVHPYAMHPTYSAPNSTHPTHQPDSRFQPQSHIVPNQDPVICTQQSTCTSTKPTDEEFNGSDKKSEHSDTSDGDGKTPLVKNTSKHNVQPSVNKSCKIEENNVVTDVNIKVNVVAMQNGKTENKDEAEIATTTALITTIVPESTITTAKEVEVKVQENVTLKDDQAENVTKTPNDSPTTSSVTSPAPTLDTAAPAKRSWASLFNNAEPKVSSLPQTTVHNNAIPVQNGVFKATEKTTAVADPVATRQNASSNNSSDCKTLQNGDLEGFYDDPNLFRMGGKWNEVSNFAK